jgi:hypothetical protein
MTRRTLFVALSALALFAWAGSVSAEEKPGVGGAHEGTVVSVGEGKLTMTGKAGSDEHTHTVAIDVKVTVDGKEGKLADLKKGDKIKVTETDKDGKKMVTRIEATRARRK